ncbi:leucine--tRNA ligase [Arenicella chitinivorans]|uniref:Leucine--tRNA ligase n=1 Tax=Arenicella chitinivorans TaxID=1329800 RepID=A0A918VLT8_9GAMM|nr:leucine--tRNA ligase [Arenicella chitinivorans]GHA11689.1 leucine--tRNA ligase [Arenicella chitinivorans]
MQQEYNPQSIEVAVQKSWADRDVYRAEENSDKEKFYCLEMFPYPSGKLHMGHVRNYTIGDVISRYQRMLGKNVLHPMGWDAFGLPAENAAIQNKTAPAAWTEQNIANMREQLKRLGFSYDWNREFATCEPDYYRWEQWFFTKLYERGLVYKKESEVNWDPVDQTVLANEQVIDGRGWRSGALVEKKKIPQWFIKITDYAEELLASLDTLDGWPDAVKTMQRNWIGKSVGAEIEFKIEGEAPLRVFTTRPDTIFGVTYVAVAADHPLAIQAAESSASVAEFRRECAQSSTAEADIETMEKRGIDLGISAQHPVTGEPVPVWCANFVLMSYGTGAVMAVPGHDQRDYEFASKYGIEIKPVIEPLEGELDISSQAFTEHGRLINSGQFDGLESGAAKSAITAWLVERSLGEERINYRLRDWGVSRQRYWGCPIPFVYDAEGNASPAQNFPVTLPTDVVMDGVGSPIKKMSSFIDTVHPLTGEPAIRETDTFDTFFESSWYYARYCCPDLDTAMLDERADHWLPVDQYVGGIEHAVMHLLYARFFHKLMRDVGLINSDEPFTRLLTQGMVTAETYYRIDDDGKRTFFNPADVELQTDDKGKVFAAVSKSDGQPVEIGGVEKMSKSKNNGVDPQSMIDKYGADTVRLFTMFAAPPDQSLEWNDDAIAGGSRFLRRVWNWFYKHQDVLTAQRLSPVAELDNANAATKALRLITHTIIKRVLFDYERQQYNTVVAAAMELMNALEKAEWSEMGVHGNLVLAEAAHALVKILAPVTPHLCDYLWSQYGNQNWLFDDEFLVLDESALVQDEITYVVQVNGKLRGKISVPADLGKAEIEHRAQEDENVARFLTDVTVRKVIVVPNKLVNIVAN